MDGGARLGSGKKDFSGVAARRLPFHGGAVVITKEGVKPDQEEAVP
jgi:hypothetical protein